MKISGDIHTNKWFQTICLGIVVFLIYTCMYNIRKAFTGLIYFETIWGFNLKIFLVLFQLIGYTISKFIGIRFIGKLKHKHRANNLILMLALATIPLLFLPYFNYHFWPILFLFNGIPLGLVWGIVFSYVEGRNHTEIIGSILACTFIFSSAWAKYLAISFTHISGLPVHSIPAAIAILSVLIIIPFIFLLDKLPSPTKQEQIRNSKRVEMTKFQQRTFFKDYSILVVPIIIIYALLTIIRDFRDNFLPEILLSSHNYDANTIKNMETGITVLLLLLLPLISIIKNHKTAILTIFIVLISGSLLCLIANLLFQEHYISNIQLITLSGIGLYAGYILINISIMDRIVGHSQKHGNAGFLMYWADSFGYLASLVVNSIAIFYRKEAFNWNAIFNHLNVFGNLGILILAVFTIIVIQKKLTVKNNHVIAK